MSETKKANYNAVLLVIPFLCAIVIMSESIYSGSAYRYTSPPRKEFNESDATFTEYFYGKDAVFWCGTVDKWKADWMPKGYEAHLTVGADNTTHSFKTLEEAEAFIYAHGCGK